MLKLQKKVRFSNFSLKMRTKLRNFIDISLLSFLSIFLSFTFKSKAETFLFKGKCAFLMTSEYQENCDILFKDRILTLIPKGSIQKRIWPHQVSLISLASEINMVPDDDISKWAEYIPDYQKTFFFIFKTKKKKTIPQWVVDATSKEEESHKFTIRYLNKNKSPQALLFILNKKENASGMISMLQEFSGLTLGKSRKSSDRIDNSISKYVYKEAMRKANRFTGLCSNDMYEDSKFIRNEFNSFIDNTNEEIAIFNNLNKLRGDLADIKIKANDFCDAIKNRQIEKENLKLAIEKRKAEEKLKIKLELEEKERLKSIEREKARKAFDMLSEF